MSMSGSCSRTARLAAWRNEWLLPAMISIGLLAFLFVVIPVNWSVFGDPEYVRMVREPGAPVGHLHRYRVLVPALVRFLPCDLNTGFQIMTLISTFIASLLVFRICRAIGLSTEKAILGVPMYLLTWPTLGNLYQPRFVDPTAWVFVAAGLLCILQVRPVVAILLGGVGALAKEMVLPLILLAAWDSMRDRRRNAWVVCGTVLMAALPSVWVWMTIPGTDSASGHLQGLVSYLVHRPSEQLRYVGIFVTLLSSFGAFGALWLLAPLGALQVDRRARRVLLAWLMLTAPFVLVGSPERMLEVFAPALLPLAAYSLAQTTPLLATLIVLTNGCFVARLSATATPFWLAWGALGVALVGSAWVWGDALRAGVVPERTK